MESWEGSELNKAKEILAYELTKLVHSEEDAIKAQESARALFSAGTAENMPTVALAAIDFIDDAIDVVTLVFKSGLVSSKSEGRRAIEQGGVTVDGEKVVDIKQAFSAERFTGEGVVVKRGKKNFRRVVTE